MKKLLKVVLAFSTILAYSSVFAEGTTYYAVGGGTKNQHAYTWTTTDNWRLDGVNGTTLPEVTPQEGDIVVFDKKLTISALVGNDYGAHPPALHKLIFNVGGCTIHQGHVALQTSGEGLLIADGVKGEMTWWAGIYLDGDGEVPIYVPSGFEFKLQKGMDVSGNTVLVKTGGGEFCTAFQDRNNYKPKKTILLGGTISPRAKGATKNHEFIWGSNDGGSRLKLRPFNNDDTSWTLDGGAMIESNVVDNTTHGITSSHTKNGYVRFIGKPAIAEHRFTGQLYGTAGIDFSPTAKQDDGSDYVFTIAKSVSTEGGALIVSNATLRLAEGASFTALKSLVLKDGGTFSVAADSGANFIGHRLEVEAGGKLSLPADIKLYFKSAYLEGVRLKQGTYTATGANGTMAAEWIMGDGVVEVSPIRIVDPIVLSVPDGSVWNLPDAIDAYNSEHGTAISVESINGGADKDRTLVKTGTGTLSMTNALQFYTGEIDVREGVVDCKCRYSLGADTANSFINVRDGATITCVMTNNTQQFNQNQTFYIAGEGFNGQGVLRTGTDFFAWGSYGAFGDHIVLEGDARVCHGEWRALPDSSVTLNGYTLTYYSINRGGDKSVFFSSVKDNGKIIFDGSSQRQQNVTFEGTDPNNTIEFRNKGGWRCWRSSMSGEGKNVWKFNFGTGSNYFHGDESILGRESGKNTFGNHWVIPEGATVYQTSQNNTQGSSLYLYGIISGAGGIAMDKGGAFKAIHLFNPANTFSGTLTVNRGTAWFYEPGTLPKAASLVVDRDLPFEVNKEAKLPAFFGVAFASVNAHDLGSCVLKGSYIGRVQGGIGRFTSVEKSGDNTIEYYSQLGAPLLDIKAGTLKLPRGAAPGLWEGTNYYEDVARAFAGTAPATNLVMRGPQTANAEALENYTPSGDKRLMTYSGYIWNRTGADANWTFVSSVGGPVKIAIDGEEVLATSGSELKKVQKTLTPGAHTFEYRSYKGKPVATDWGENCGFMYDTQGRADPWTNECVRCVDPGDGSLFTRSLDSADLPAFDAIHIAAGAMLDINGNTYSVANISGAGTVTSSATDAMAAPKLVMSGMTVNVGVNETLTVAVPCEFGADFEVSVTNVAQAIPGKHVAFVADKGITGASSIRVVADDGSQWTARLASDGKSLEVCRTGFILIFR